MTEAEELELLELELEAANANQASPDQTQAADVDWHLRFVIKNFSTSPEVGAEYLRENGFEATVADGEIYAKPKGAPGGMQPLDPTNNYLGDFASDLMNPGSLFRKAKEGAGTEFLQDVGDLAYDIPAGIAQGAATAGGGLMGGIPGAMVAGSGTGAGLEGLRQLLGKQAGLKNNANMTQMGLAGGVGALAPALFGSGATAKQIANYAARKGIPEAALAQANRSPVMRSLPYLASATSGARVKDIKTYYNRRAEVLMAGPELADDISRQVNEGVSDLGIQAERDLSQQFPAEQLDEIVSPDYADFNVQIGQARADLEDKVAKGIATKAEVAAAKKAAEADFKAAKKALADEYKATQKQQNMAFNKQLDANKSASKETKQEMRSQFNREQQERKLEFENSQREFEADFISKEANRNREAARQRLAGTVGEDVDAGLKDRMAQVHQSLSDSLQFQKERVGQSLNSALESSGGIIKLNEILKPIDDAIAKLAGSETAITPSSQANLEALINARKAMVENLPDEISAKAAFELQDAFRNNAKFSQGGAFSQRYGAGDDMAEKIWKSANAKAYDATNKRLEDVAGTQGIKDQYRNLIRMQKNMDSKFSTPEQMYKTISSSDKPESLFTRSEIDEIKNLTNGQIDLNKELVNIRDHALLMAPDEKAVNKEVIKRASLDYKNINKQKLSEAAEQYKAQQQNIENQLAEQNRQLKEQLESQLSGAEQNFQKQQAGLAPQEVGISPTMTDEEISKNKALLGRLTRRYPDQTGVEQSLGSKTRAPDVDSYLQQQGVPIDEFKAAQEKLVADRARQADIARQNAENEKMIQSVLAGKAEPTSMTPAIENYQKAKQTLMPRFGSGEQSYKTLTGIGSPSKAYTTKAIGEAEKLIGTEGSAQDKADLLRAAITFTDAGLMPLSSGGVTSTSRSMLMGNGPQQMLGGPKAVKGIMDASLWINEAMPWLKKAAPAPARFSPWLSLEAKKKYGGADGN